MPDTPDMNDMNDSASPRSPRVLLLEDDALLARYFGLMLGKLGAPEVVIAHDNDAAMALVEAHGVVAAFLDVGLRGGTSEATAHLLTERGIPFTFLSGRSLDGPLRKAFPGAHLLMKPAASPDIAAMLATLGCRPG